VECEIVHLRARGRAHRCTRGPEVEEFGSSCLTHVRMSGSSCQTQGKRSALVVRHE